MSSAMLARIGSAFALALLVLGAVGCASKPVVRAQTAPGGNVATYRTYGFFDRLGTDDSTYSSALSLNLKVAVARELESRGYRAAPQPDLLVNFHVAEKDKLEGHTGPSVGFGVGGYGYPWRYGYGWGLGVHDTDLKTTTEGTLTVDVVDRARNEIVWAGSVTGEITPKMRDDPRAAIDRAIPLIFTKFPGRAAF